MDSRDAGADGYCERVRFFNTDGPCGPARHYMLPAEPRLPGVMRYIEQGRYIILHAPRQTGKTTTLYALERDLNAGGEYVALVVSCEQAAPAGDNYGAVASALLAQITEEAFALGMSPERMPPSPWPDSPPENRLRNGHDRLAAVMPAADRAVSRRDRLAGKRVPD